MEHRNINDLRAEAFADQCKAAVRNGEEFPEHGDICSAAAHAINPDDAPPGMRDVIRRLQKAWAEEANVTPFEERTDLQSAP